MLAMTAALFLTASRAGFIDLVISGSVCLWHFGVKGRRPQLIVAATLVVGVLLIAAGGLLRARFATMFSDEIDPSVYNAYGSYEQRKFLYFKSLEGIEYHPLLGVGPRCFANYSGIWREVHNAYLQIAVEGGIPVLILYLIFLERGFANLRKLRKRRDLDTHTTLFIGALHSSLIGFIVGALFAPEAYQFFPYFAVAQTSVLAAIVREQESKAEPVPESSRGPRRLWEINARDRRASELTPVR
jgi:O-antigen ligase